MSINRQHLLTYVLDDFPGFVAGPSATKAPPGAFVVHDATKYTRNVQFSNYGEVINSGGYSKVLAASDFASYNGLYHWVSPVGGDFLLGYKSAGRTRVLRVGASSILFSLMGTGSEVDTEALIHPTRYSSYVSFEPFGDSLYIADGINPPFRLSLDGDEVNPIVHYMGVYRDIDSLAVMMDLDARSNLALTSMDKMGVGRSYNFTAMSKYGESQAASSYIRGAFALGAVSSYDNVGPLGATPVITINWLDVPEHIYAINLYRTARASNRFQFLTRIPRGVSSFIDSKADYELGWPMPQDNGPPGVFRLLKSYQDRMFAVGGDMGPNYIQCSKVGLPDVWPPQYGITTMDTGRGDTITQLAVVNSSLFVFMSRHILRLVGTAPENYYLESVSDQIGCVAPRSMAYWQDGVIFVSEQGIFFFNGSTLRDISGSIRGLFDQYAYGVTDLSTSAGIVAGDNYYWSYAEAGEAADTLNTPHVYPNRVMICHIPTGKWGTRLSGEFHLGCSYKHNQAFAFGQDKGSGTGYLFLISDWPMQNIALTGPTMFMDNLDLGYPDQVKILQSVEVWYESLMPVTMTVTAYRERPHKDTGGVHPTGYGVTGTILLSEAVQTTKDDSTANDPEWGDTWNANLYYKSMEVHRSTHQFNKMSGKSFGIKLAVGSGAPELRIQKIIFRFYPEDPLQKGYSSTMSITGA